MTVIYDSQDKVLGLDPCKMTGLAFAAYPNDQGKWKIKFPFASGEFWFLEVGPKTTQGFYSYLIVSDAKRAAFYLMARTQTIDTALYNSLIEKYGKLGFDTKKIVMSKQSSSCANAPLNSRLN
jgi:lipocalin